MRFDKPFFWLVIFNAILQLLTAQIGPLQEMHLSTEQLIRKQQGILSTFDLNVTTENIKITWSFTLPKDAIFTLHVKKLKFHFQMEPRCPSCCPENALYVPNNYQGQHVYCANSIFETITANENNFFITFASQYLSQGVELQFSIRRRTEACSAFSFQCFDKKDCYNINKICDGEFDCDDHTDEQNCSKCRTNYTMCNNEDRASVEHVNCFHPEQHRCDGIFHCRTGEDEINCVDECKNQIQCTDKTACYTLQQRCDGIFNCEDHSDEANCHSIKCEVLSNTSDYFACKNGWCIRKFKFYDGIIDCDDGSDETTYSVNAFTVKLCFYILIILSMLWIGAIWCSGMYKGHSHTKHTKQEIRNESSFMYNYIMKRPKNNAALQISRPVLSSEPRYCLKPTELTSSNSTSTDSLPLYEIVDAPPTSLQPVTTIYKNYENTQFQSLKVTHHTNDPSVIGKTSKTKIRANSLKMVENDVYKESDTTPETVHRLKTFEVWI